MYVAAPKVRLFPLALKEAKGVVAPMEPKEMAPVPDVTVRAELPSTVLVKVTPAPGDAPAFVESMATGVPVSVKGPVSVTAPLLVVIPPFIRSVPVSCTAPVEKTAAACVIVAPLMVSELKGVSVVPTWPDKVTVPVVVRLRV